MKAFQLFDFLRRIPKRKTVFVINSGKHFLSRNALTERCIWREDPDTAIYFSNRISAYVFIWKMRSRYSAFNYSLKKHYVYPTREFKVKPDPIPVNQNHIRYE